MILKMSFVVFLVLMVLKLTGHIALSWFWIAMPLVGGFLGWMAWGLFWFLVALVFVKVIDK
jgi:hypothetical protein